MANKPIHLAWKAEEYEHGHLNAGPPQSNAFFRCSDTQPVSASVPQALSNSDHVGAVCVRLDYAHKLPMRSDELTERRNVALYGSEIDVESSRCRVVDEAHPRIRYVGVSGNMHQSDIAGPQL